MITFRSLPLLFALVLTGWSITEAQESGTTVSFNRDVRPILSDKCFHCHGPDEKTRRSDLRLDDRESAMNTITPGEIDDSELIARILDDDPAVQMPPPEIHKPLEPDEIELIKRWVKQGATWDKFWAYQPPQKTKIPTPKDSEWSINWIDEMILTRLESKQLAPSPTAERHTLIRRLYFDLIGLPPTLDQVRDFVNDQSPDAYEKTVERLLASKHFGERLAVYWLDLVRYADTVGYHGDQDHNISPYRDWVINALNDNMPFDQFTREQLAGDLLPGSTRDQKIASGYNRLLQTTHEGGLQPGEYSAIYAADRVRNVSTVWMAATVGCAQCHDHKYDPYTAKDFYKLAAVFADIDDQKHFKDGTNALPTRRSPEILVWQSAADESNHTAQTQQVKQLQKKLDGFKRDKSELQKKQEKQKEQAQPLQPATPDQKSTNVKEADKSAPNPPSSRRKSATNPAESSTGGSSNDLTKQITAVETLITSANQELKKAKAKLKGLESRGAWTMITRALERPRTVRVLARGDWMDQTGPIVKPGTPSFLESPTTQTRFTRLDLANWLTDASGANGKLTARVFANRIWYLLMGVGISKSLDDFGGQGVAPEFPELLDNLALEFASDWNIKRLMRQIVMSKTYRQSSLATEQMRKLDPYNQLFARQSRYRLPAETIRDSALAISGLLNVDQIGGKSVKPYQPAHYYRHLNFPPRKYVHHTDSRQWRRGVYVHWQRMFLHPSLKALDAPSREECTCQRPRSNTPLAALSLLNDPSFVEAARVFAEKIMKHSQPDTIQSRVDFAFEWTVSRRPTEVERKVIIELFESSLTEYRKTPEAARQLITTGQWQGDPKLNPSELAAWTSVARALLNLSETITRN